MTSCGLTPASRTQNDLEPALAGVLPGAPDLTTAALVEAHVKKPDGTIYARTVTPGAAGAWSVPIGFGDLDLAGQYRIEVEVQQTANRPQTYGPDVFQVGREIPAPPVTLPETPPGSGLYAGALVESPPGSGLYQIGT